MTDQSLTKEQMQELKIKLRACGVLLTRGLTLLDIQDLSGRGFPVNENGDIIISRDVLMACMKGRDGQH